MEDIKRIVTRMSAKLCPEEEKEAPKKVSDAPKQVLFGRLANAMGRRTSILVGKYDKRGSHLGTSPSKITEMLSKGQKPTVS